MKAVKMILVSAALMSMGWGVYGDPIYRIDIDSTHGGAAIDTEPGWTSLPLDDLGAGSVTLDGITFSVASQDGTRSRAGGGSLLRDFAFDDGAGQALIFVMGGAGALSAGMWEVSMYAFDSGSGATGPMIAGLRRNGAETIIDTNVPVGNTDPAITFTFESDGIGTYDVFFRENNDQNRTRLNAVILSKVIPEPGTGLLLSAGLVALAFLRRQR